MSTATYQMTPDEAFLREALKIGRAKIQQLSMKALGKVDAQLQCRVQHLDVEHVRRLSAIHDETGIIAPIVVFEDAKSGARWIADGFHRHRMLEMKRAPAIRAYVINGTRLDALEFSTMCNRQLCLPRTREDVRKAIEMLLEVEQYRVWGDNKIGEHVGCSPSLVRRIRIAWHEKKLIPMPERFEGRDGSQRRSRSKMKDGTQLPMLRQAVFRKGERKYNYFSTKHKGQTIYLGRSEEQATEKLAALHATICSKKRKVGARNLYAMLQRYCAATSVIPPYSHNSYPGIIAFQVHGAIIVGCEFQNAKALPLAIGILECADEIAGPGLRRIVACYPEDGPSITIELYRKRGYEFLMPDKVLAAFATTGIS